MWTCPTCGRDFKRKNQSHSCKAVNSVEEYIATFPKEEQSILHDLRNIIKSSASNAEEKLSWQMPTYFQNGNVIHFAMQKNHLGLHVGSTAIKTFKDELSNYSFEKGTIRLSKEEALPKDLIERIVQYNIKKNLSK